MSWSMSAGPEMGPIAIAERISAAASLADRVRAIGDAMPGRIARVQCRLRKRRLRAVRAAGRRAG